jgi:hypothetical protein
MDQDNFNLINMLIDIMCDANMTLLKGKDKKAMVLTEVKLLIGAETFNRYSPILSMAVDSIVSISKKDVKLILAKSSNICLKLSKGCKK